MFKQREEFIRYRNRKLYHRGKDACQNDIQRMIAAGKEVLVLDKLSGADITREVLASMLWIRSKPEIFSMDLNSLLRELRDATDQIN